jgi:hypothetical protein
MPRDRHAIITDLIDGQYRNPSRVIAFNTAQWSRDVSAEFGRGAAEKIAGSERNYAEVAKAVTDEACRKSSNS